MARIRSLKPEFWDDRKLARSVSRDARLLYMGLWNQADEHCRLNGDELWLKGRVFPYDDDVLPDDVTGFLDQLEAAGRIERYDVDGDPFIYLPKLSKHQRLEPAKVDSRHPAPPTHSDAEPSEPGADQSAQDAKSSTLLYGSGSMDQGSGSMGQGDARGSRIPDDWTPDDKLVNAMRAEGIPDALARRELVKFRDHWAAQPGARGRKSDWSATWRNWLRRAAENLPASRNAATGSTADQRVSEGMNVAAELRREQQDFPREISA